jgi:protein-tyrosine phosphatase
MPRPRGGDWLEDEIVSWSRSGFDVVVSLLESGEADELVLGAEPALCEAAGIRFIHFPIPDRETPTVETALSELVETLVTELRAERSVGVHCRMGIGRSASVAVCVLAALGVPLDSAWEAVRNARGFQVPDTSQQHDWVAAWVAGFLRKTG